MIFFITDYPAYLKEVLRVFFFKIQKRKEKRERTLHFSLVQRRKNYLIINFVKEETLAYPLLYGIVCTIY